jgi:hypothetical protein
MAYDREEIITQAIRVIDDEQITRVTDLVAYLPISRATFYGWELDKLDILDEKVKDLKISLKNKMKRKWVEGDNPALQIAAFKLIAEDDEVDKVTLTKVKNETTMTVKPSVSIAFDGTQDDSGQSDPAV